MRGNAFLLMGLMFFCENPASSDDRENGIVC